MVYTLARSMSTPASEMMWLKYEMESTPKVHLDHLMKSLSY